MAEVNLIQDGIDRVQSAFESLDKEYRRLQKRAEKRRRELEKRAEKRVKQLRADLRRNPVVRRAEDLREDARKRFEDQVEQLLATFKIATRGEVRKLDRKVTQLSKKLRALEKTRDNGASASL